MADELGPDGRGWNSKEVEYHLGNAGPGKSVVITTSRSVQVCIFDDSNYRLYKDGQESKAMRGQIQSSPFRFKLPREEEWHVVIDPKTYSGIAEFSVSLMDDDVLDD